MILKLFIFGAAILNFTVYSHRRGRQLYSRHRTRTGFWSRRRSDYARKLLARADETPRSCALGTEGERYAGLLELEGTTGLLELERPARRLEWKRHAGLPELEGSARLLELERSAGLLELKWSAGLLKLEGAAEEQRTPAAARWEAGHVIAGAGEVEGAVVRRPANVTLGASETREGCAADLGFHVFTLLSGKRSPAFHRPHRAVKTLYGAAGKGYQALGTTLKRHVAARAGKETRTDVRRPADILLAAVELRTGAGNLGFQTVSHQPGELIHVFLGQTAAHFPDYINCMQGNESNPLIGFHLHILLIHRQYFSGYFFTINQFDDNVFTLSRL